MQQLVGPVLVNPIYFSQGSFAYNDHILVVVGQGVVNILISVGPGLPQLELARPIIELIHVNISLEVGRNELVIFSDLDLHVPILTAENNFLNFGDGVIGAAVCEDIELFHGGNDDVGLVGSDLDV